LTQTPGKSDRRKNEKGEKNLSENHSFKIRTPEGKRRIWASIPTPNHKKYTTKISEYFDLSHEHEGANPREEEQK
jgi:hypothetical protein